MLIKGLSEAWMAIGDITLKVIRHPKKPTYIDINCNHSSGGTYLTIDQLDGFILELSNLRNTLREELKDSDNTGTRLP